MMMSEYIFEHPSVVLLFQELTLLLIAPLPLQEWRGK